MKFKEDLVIWRRVEDVEENLPPTITGIYIDSEQEFKKYLELSPPMQISSFSPWFSSYGINPCYIGEPKATFGRWEDVKDLLANQGVWFVDEPSIRLLETYTSPLFKYLYISFSAYRDYVEWIENLLGVRLYIPFTTPLRKWKKVQQMFGKRFDRVWISASTNTYKWQIRKMLTWAKENNKGVLLYCKEVENKEDLSSWLHKFGQVYSEVVG